MLTAYPGRVGLRFDDEEGNKFVALKLLREEWIRLVYNEA
jgi:hypothetical protein